MQLFAMQGELQLAALKASASRDLMSSQLRPSRTPDAIDPLYFDGQMYYLLPSDGAATEPYAVFVAAMEHEDHFAVGQIVLSGKKQLALVRPYEHVLHLALLNYAAEIRPPDQLTGIPALPKRVSRQVQLAQTLIREWTDDRFAFADYVDDYREELAKLIKAKVAGKEVVRPRPATTRPHVINLMEALQQSLGAAPRAHKKKAAPRKRKRSA